MPPIDRHESAGWLVGCSNFNGPSTHSLVAAELYIYASIFGSSPHLYAAEQRHIFIYKEADAKF